MKLKNLLIIFFLFLNFNINANQSINENEIHKNLRCLVCQGQSIADSNSDFAITLKMVVSDLIKQGKSEEEIYNFYQINTEIGYCISLNLTLGIFYRVFLI